MDQGGLPAGLPLIGEKLGGKYEIVRLLGEGGMAFVFEAVHKRLDQRVAIKVMAPEFAADEELVARFEREARAIARLRSRHVVRVIDVEVTASGLPYIVMEFLEGRDLDAELQARKRLPLGESVDIVLQACSCMHEAHGLGIVHRDLKPGNLFLVRGREATETVVKVLDFGISKVAGETATLTGAGVVMGTILYMAPEQVRADPDVDRRADIWALGVILFEILAGRAPFEGSSPQIAAKIVSSEPPDLTTLTSVPEGLALAVRRMLERDRARRFSTVAEVVTALAPFASMGSIGAGVVEKLAMGTTGSRGRTVPFAPNRTVPMPGARGSVAPITDGSRASAPTPPPRATGHVTAAPVTATTKSAGPRRRLVFILAIAFTVLLAAGAVLTVLALRRSKEARRAGAAADAATTAPAHPPARPALSASTKAEPAPPSTGTTGGVTGTAGAGSGRATQPRPASSARRDGGAAPSAPSAMPDFL